MIPTPTQTQTQVAMVGAGTAGCLTAHLLQKAGVDCLLIEKSRGPGGRCSRRRVNGIENYGVDLGGNEFDINPHTPNHVKHFLNHLQEQGALAIWQKESASFDTSNASIVQNTSLCGAPSMNKWHRHMAADTPIATQNRATRIHRTHGLWQVFDEQDQLITKAKCVIITAPPEQTRELLATVNAPNQLPIPHGLPMQSLPQYVCAIGFEQGLDLAAKVYQDQHSVLSKAIKENSKPKRVSAPGFAEVWILHSTHKWAQEQAHGPATQAANSLSESFCEHFGIQQTPQILTSHYWRMAGAEPCTNQSQGSIWDASLKLGCCADWLGGGNTTGAVNSALNLHEKMLQSLVSIGEIA